MSYNESLSTRSNYPPMSQYDWDRAPWNEVDELTNEIEVTVSITLSKQFTLNCSENDDLKEAIKEAKYLPQEAYQLLKDYLKTKSITNVKTKIKDLEGWNVDDFEVIPE